MQLDTLFNEVEGFHDFMLHIANKKAKDSIYGTVYQVAIGALLSTTDIITDIYVVATYYKTPSLRVQANALLAMFAANTFIQLLIILGVYSKKSTGTKVKEVLISLFFLRPLVDAYRLSKNEDDDNEKPLDQLSELIANKGVEMAAEGVPGCILQLYVWLSNPQAAGTFALLSIAISALTTGYTSAIISFSLDTDQSHRVNQPRFYGYIKNSSAARGRTFILMTLISTLHNLSRSLGCALLIAGGGKRVAAMFLGGEMVVYLLSKVVRGDFWWFGRIESAKLAVVLSVLQRTAVKVITDFTGCLHFRHPFELGAITFSISMVYAQIFPFVAFFLYGDAISEDEGVKKRILIFLVGSLSAWLLLNIIFFKTIDTSYIKTFFGTMTAPQYTCDYFTSSNEDFQKWDAFVENRIEYSTAIHDDVKEWVADNIDGWMADKPAWFNISMIPDDFLPADVLEAAGGADRRRASVGLMKMIKRRRSTLQSFGGESSDSELLRREWKALAEDIYAIKTNNGKENFTNLNKIFQQNETLLSPLLSRCPLFQRLLSILLVDRLRFRVRAVDTIDIREWEEEDCERAAKSLVSFIRTRNDGPGALVAWRYHYEQLNVLFTEVEGFNEFMQVITHNLVRDSVFGTIWRVSVGAGLSVIDAATDIYTIFTYRKTDELKGQATALAVMIGLNMLLQSGFVLAQYKKKSWLGKVKEFLIVIFFLRPVVDAYRTSKNREDDEIAVSHLTELIINKGIELACESIPGCVLQIYVFLTNREDAGTYALLSILICVVTTGYTSAIIAFSTDVALAGRTNQPKHNGYVPENDRLRSRCFWLMTAMGALHNLSRSVGCALLIVAGGKTLAAVFLGGEMALYLLYKLGRGDMFYFMRVDGVLAVILGVSTRFLVKVGADFSGCLHFRHPYEMGGLAFSVNIVYAQIFPFVALYLYQKSVDDVDENQSITVGLIGSFGLWVAVVVAFFCTIEKKYIRTFFSRKTAAEYTCERFVTNEADNMKFAAAFENRMDYKKGIEGEVKAWVEGNIGRWLTEKPEWFKVEMIPDDFLPAGVIAAEGGAGRRRSSVSVFGALSPDDSRNRVNSIVVKENRTINPTVSGSVTRKAWRLLAEELYDIRSNNYKSNIIHITRVFDSHAELVAPLLERCPSFKIILSFILEDRMGFRVRKVDWTGDMKSWGLEESKRVGCALATFLRKRKTAEVAVIAWASHYAQLTILFDEIEGFMDFMTVIGSKTLRDSIYGTVYRVTLGAVLSTVDATTDIYVLTTYYQSGLVGKASSLLAMILTNTFIQLLVVAVQCKKKSWKVKIRELFVTLLFLRPAVDAYRVSTNYEEEKSSLDPLYEMIVNKGIEVREISTCATQ